MCTGSITEQKGSGHMWVAELCLLPAPEDMLPLVSDWSANSASPLRIFICEVREVIFTFQSPLGCGRKEELLDPADSFYPRSINPQLLSGLNVSKHLGQHIE
jgi:hypothetical protein